MSRDQQSRRLAAEFDELSRVLRAEDPNAVHGAIADSCVRLVDGCDHAAVSMMRNGKFRTAAASDDVARRLDELQIETGEGPCLDSAAGPQWEHHVDLAEVQEPNEFQRRLRDETPIRSVLAFRLMDDGRKTGALNLAATRSHAFDDRAAGEAAIFASFASVALMAAEAQRRAEELRRGLDTSREIGTAVGILAASHGVSPDDAFAELVRVSQSLQRKLRDVAREVVAGDALPPRTGDIP